MTAGHYPRTVGQRTQSKDYHITIAFMEKKLCMKY